MDEHATAYTFDDINILPGHYSEELWDKLLGLSRSDPIIDITSRVSREVVLNTPILSSYMPSVTDATTAIELARLGGMGIIPREMSVHNQAAEVDRVKRAESIVIEHPFTVLENADFTEINALMRQHKVGGILVVDAIGRLKGIVTTRDMEFETDERKMASELMTPRERLIVGNRRITEKKAEGIFRENKHIEKLPLVGRNNKLIGLVSRKTIRLRRNGIAARDKDGRLRVAATIGIRGANFMERAEALLAAGVDVIFLAIANGYLPSCIHAVRELRKNFPDIDLIAGNIADYEGAKLLLSPGGGVDHGADGVLTAIGPGSICETQRVAGVGVPMLTSVAWAAEAAREHKAVVISDGGIRYGIPSDLGKVILFGASAAIMGSVIAGTTEAPGDAVTIGGVQMKQHIGLSSLTAKERLAEIEGRQASTRYDNSYEEFYYHTTGEGVESAHVPLRGSLMNVLKDYVGGLRSAMTYTGSLCIEDLHQHGRDGKFVVVSPAGRREGNPHGLFIERE